MTDENTTPATDDVVATPAEEVVEEAPAVAGEETPEAPAEAPAA